jgi:hypothetical protein
MKGSPSYRDLDAKAEEGLEAARSMPHGPEKTEALKKAGLLRRAADARGITFAKRGSRSPTSSQIALQCLRPILTASTAFVPARRIALAQLSNY